jgi:hypothetical protein
VPVRQWFTRRRFKHGETHDFQACDRHLTQRLSSHARSICRRASERHSNATCRRVWDFQSTLEPSCAQAAERLVADPELSQALIEMPSGSPPRPTDRTRQPVVAASGLDDPFGGGPPDDTPHPGTRRPSADAERKNSGHIPKQLPARRKKIVLRGRSSCALVLESRLCIGAVAPSSRSKLALFFRSVPLG